MGKLPAIEDLLAAAKGGDKEAENQLFLHLRARILQLVQQRIWNTRRHASEIRRDAEDLTEDVCVVILQQYKTAALYRGFLPWLMQIVRHRVGQYYRECNRREQKRGPVTDEYEIVDRAVGPQGELEASELDDIITRALGKMGQRCAEIIEALIAGDIKTYVEEQRSATPLGTIYNQIHRCRENLKFLLRKQGYKICVVRTPKLGS